MTKEESYFFMVDDPFPGLFLLPKDRRKKHVDKVLRKMGR
jgi:hypothetical protein